MVGVLVALGLLIAGVLIYLASLPAEYQVRRRLVINVAPQLVYDRIRDFPGWKEWSPWLIHEPDAKLSYSDDPSAEGGSYSWDGRCIGAGRLIHQHFDAPGRIDQRIEFVRPFRSVSTVGWTFEPVDVATEGTEVTWSMSGRMPFLMRFMTSRMDDMVGKDYELGLAMLNGVLDPAADRPLVRFDDEVLLEPLSSLCLPWSGTLDDIDGAMKDGMPRLAAAVDESSRKGAPFTAYNRVNPKTRKVSCDMAIPVGEDVAAGEFVRREIGGGRFFKVTLYGDYRFLELVWYSAMGHLKMCKLRYDGSRPALEVYENDPASVEHRNALHTTLYLPLK